MLSAVACRSFLVGVCFSGIDWVCSIEVTAQLYLWHRVNTRVHHPLQHLELKHITASNALE